MNNKCMVVALENRISKLEKIIEDMDNSIRYLQFMYTPIKNDFYDGYDGYADKCVKCGLETNDCIGYICSDEECPCNIGKIIGD